MAPMVPMAPSQPCLPPRRARRSGPCAFLRVSRHAPPRHAIPGHAGPGRALLVGRTVVAAALVLASTAAYTVRPGDTLSQIAVRQGVSTAALASANGLSDPDRILAGMSLRLPTSATGARTHRVERGQTLSGIAVRYGVPVRVLAEANGLRDADRVLAGRRLRIPDASPAAPAASGGTAGPPRGAAARAEVGALLESTARRYGWRPATVKALAWQESGWNPRALSSAGAIGVMQVLPSTGRFVSQNLVGRPLDLRDPADNIEAGVAFLDYLHGLTGGDARRTLGGYYQGLRSMERNGVYPDTVRYIDNVLTLRRRF